jgi:hypothetical protein
LTIIARFPISMKTKDYLKNGVEPPYSTQFPVVGPETGSNLRHNKSQAGALCNESCSNVVLRDAFW